MNITNHLLDLEKVKIKFFNKKIGSLPLLGVWLILWKRKPEKKISEDPEFSHRGLKALVSNS